MFSEDDSGQACFYKELFLAMDYGCGRLRVRSCTGSTITLGLGGSIQGAIGDFDGEIEANGWRLPDRGFSYIIYPSETDCQDICVLTSFDVGDSTNDV